MTAILITIATVAPGGLDALEQYATGTIPPLRRTSDAIGNKK